MRSAWVVVAIVALALFAPTGQQHISPGQSEAVKPRSAALGETTQDGASPERAKQEFGQHRIVCFALSGLGLSDFLTQGGAPRLTSFRSALGWYVKALTGRDLGNLTISKLANPKFTNPFPSFSPGKLAASGPQLRRPAWRSTTRSAAQRSITDRSIDWPEWSQWRRVLFLEDYNTRVVVLGTTLLGAAAGMVGSFTLLRKRALMGDALSHATLPGIGLAFMVASALGASGKSLPVLLFGAAASGLVGVAAILFIRNLTRLKEDAALGIVLSVFFGAGVAVLGVVQQMKTGHAAGLEAFIYGKTASMVASDALLIGAAGLVCVVVSAALFKELKLLCFDEGFAGARGFPVVGLDMTLMAMVVIVTIIGLQAVGLILMIALLVIPAAAARFWTEKMLQMTLIAAALGAASGMVGAEMSGVFPRLPSGAMIVLVAALFFLVSMVFGSARGVLIRWLRRQQLNRKIDRQHLLRGMFEYLEARGLSTEQPNAGGPVSFEAILALRSWSPSRFRREVLRAQRERLVQMPAPDRLCLTASGFAEAARLTRQHRLWELYLIARADIAPGRVDRDADAIEHVLEPEMIAELESLLDQRQSTQGVPRSPHEIQMGPAQGASTRSNG